jgi:hypothetical protein
MKRFLQAISSLLEKCGKRILLEPDFGLGDLYDLGNRCRCSAGRVTPRS